MSNHRNPNIPTALCPWCDEYFALTAHGAFRQHRCLHHVDLEKRIGRDAEAAARDHIGQKFLTGYYAAIASSDALNNHSHNTWGACHQLLRQLLWILHHRAGARVNTQQRRSGFHRRRAGCTHRANRAANREALDHLGQPFAKIILELGAYPLIDHIQGRMQQLARFQILHLVTISELKTYFAIRTNGK